MSSTLAGSIGWLNVTAIPLPSEPLRTIPRAVIQSAILTGGFLLVCTYAEVMGFHGSPVSFGDSPAPLRYLAEQVGVRFLGPLIDAGAVVSMFACVLACITAAARVLMLMAHHGLAHKWLTHTHKRNATPGGAVLVVGLLMLLPTWTPETCTYWPAEKFCVPVVVTVTLPVPMPCSIGMPLP